MVALPELESYSAQQLNQARETSAAFAQYERLIANADIDKLHYERHRAWMKCTLATYFKTESTEQVCLYWSQTADRLLKSVWQEEGLDELDAVLFALGKHGASELNLSSDIDLLLVAEPDHAAAVARKMRRFQTRLQTPTEFGFCFRLDFDLRPGGTVGPLITSTSQFQDYYWSQGETWERLAMVRLRAICGSKPLAKQIQDLSRRFSYRKFLDFTLLEDLKALRLQVHQKGFQRLDGELHIKLEVGGIRDIELFVHSLLVMNGGKLPQVQTRSTDQGLRNLGEHGLFNAIEADFLRESYWFYRHLENTVQSLEDRQTHSLTASLLEQLKLPAMSEIVEQMQLVDGIVSGLLGKLDLQQSHLPSDPESQRTWLTGLGFSAKVVDTAWMQLMDATALSHKNDRDERARQEFLFAFVTELSKHKGLDRDLGLQLLGDFVRATRAKATFFAMLLRSPGLLKDLSRLFCLSPYLSSILTSRPELLDHYILRVDEAWAADMEPLLQQMSERKLLTELWSASRFLNDRDLSALFSQVTATADEITQQLLSQLKHDYPDSLIKTIALGKWGGRELGLRSDLDFIFVTPASPKESDFKVARRFISRLTDPVKGGHLYDVDLRLRPSGQSGPLLVAEERLHEYWRDSAQAWERQAYLRARGFGLQLDKSVLFSRGLSEEELKELKRIGLKLMKPASASGLDIKYVPGGLLDIELGVQTALLHGQQLTEATSTDDMIIFLADHFEAWKSHGHRLRAIYNRLRLFEQMLQLSSTYKTGVVRADHPVLEKSAALLGLSAQSAWHELEALTAEARSLLNRLDPRGA